jgi:hypothetical protein
LSAPGQRLDVIAGDRNDRLRDSAEKLMKLSEFLISCAMPAVGWPREAAVHQPHGSERRAAEPYRPFHDRVVAFLERGLDGSGFVPFTGRLDGFGERLREGRPDGHVGTGR